MKTHIICLIEDNPDDVKLTRRAFAQSRIINEVVIAKDGAEALEYLAACTSLPSLILLDLHLPKVSGLEVLKVIRTTPRLKLLPVVVLTSSSEDRDIVESYTLGANSYIRKPVDFDQFMEAVKKLEVYWLLLNEPPPHDWRPA